ncbi:pyrimidine (deoxy)nucleoside triphosphate diphosphatase [Spirochaetota bacterium]
MRSVAGIAIRNKKIFAAKRREGGSMGGKWEFPGGKLESGESEAEAVIREYAEEFGLNVLPVKVIGNSSFTNDLKHYSLTAYHIKFDGEPLFLLEHYETAWLGLPELEQLDLSDSDRSLLGFVKELLAAD